MTSIRNTRKHWIPVVAGLIRRGDEILVGQRPENNTLAGLWEFPGGKIELGEGPEEALARELYEELDINVEVGPLKLSCTHNYGDVGIIILFYEVNYWKGEPKAKHHMQIEWVSPQELKKRTIPDANKKILDRIFESLGWPWHE